MTPSIDSLRKPAPLRVMFVITSMPVGGAETLLVNLVRRLDRARFAPELCCLKQLGPLGEELAAEIPAHSELLASKFDVRILPRLTTLFRTREIDAVVTVGAGDKMFWGRLAAWRAGVPVVISALHSTGWPDGIGRLNRRLTPITDAFVGVAASHGRHLVEVEGFPQHKVRVIPNGVDTDRFSPRPGGETLAASLGLPPASPRVGIVAALRPEKNHTLFMQTAAVVARRLPETQFLIVGDGPERPRLERQAAELGIANVTHFLGNRSDVPNVVSLFDVFALTSHNEANPVSILEAMSLAKPVVATNVGSVSESVAHGRTGYLVEPGDCDAMAAHWLDLLRHPLPAHEMGETGRNWVVEHASLGGMVRGYEALIDEIYISKQTPTGGPTPSLRRAIG